MQGITSGNRSKLVKAILMRKWNKVRAILSTSAGREDACEVFDSGITVLSIASSCDPPPDVVKTLLGIEPLNSLKVDKFGMLPIHIACMTGASARTVKLILDHDDGACAQAIDAMHRAPLHYAIDFMCEPGTNICGVPAVTDSMDTTISMQSMNISEDDREPSTQASRRSADSLTLTMSQDKFMDQMQVVRYLVDASPEIVLFADSRGNTPIDILQDCKAENDQKCPKWERADICCEMLRKVAISEYKEQKLVSEMRGYNCKRFSTSLSVPSMTSSSGGSTDISGMSNISKMEIDGTSYNKMDLSAGSDDTNDHLEAKNKMNVKKACIDNFSETNEERFISMEF